MSNDLATTDAAEDRLRSLLAERASLARVSPDAAAIIEARIRDNRRSSSKRRIAVAAAAAAATTLAGGLWSQLGSPVLVTADGDGRRPVEQATPETTLPKQTSPRPFPRLALTIAGLVVDHVEEYTSSPDVDRPGEVFTQVFRAASGGPASPALTVRTIAAGAAHGIGEDSPREAVDAVEVNGRPGFLVNKDSLSPSLGWRLADGRAVQLEAIGFPGDALVDIARQMEPRADARGWALPLSSMPALVEGEVTFGGSRSSEVQYTTPRGDRLAVRVFEGDRLRFEDLLLDRASAASTYQPVVINGADGVLFSTGDGHLAVSYADGYVVEIALMADRDAALSALASLTEITEEAWQALR